MFHRGDLTSCRGKVDFVFETVEHMLHLLGSGLVEASYMLTEDVVTSIGGPGLRLSAMFPGKVMIFTHQ